MYSNIEETYKNRSWPCAQVGPGPNWAQGPSGPRAQVGPGPKWSQGPVGPWARAQGPGPGPGPKLVSRARKPEEPIFQKRSKNEICFV